MSQPTTKFLVKKGMVVFSTRPDWPSEGLPARMDYEVDAVFYQHGQVKWAGAGGYWKWVKTRRPRETWLA